MQADASLVVASQNVVHEIHSTLSPERRGRPSPNGPLGSPAPVLPEKSSTLYSQPLLALFSWPASL